MPTYYYRALSSDHQPAQGVAQAESKADLVKRLEGQGLLLLSLNEGERVPASVSPLVFSFNRRERLSNNQIALLTRQLATLLAAGLDLDRSLSVQIELADGEVARQLLKRVQASVQGGKTLADALAEEKIFSRIYIQMVRAGELAGAHAPMLHRLAEYMEKSQAFRGKITSALIYPAVLLTVASISIIVMITVVLPRFEAMFEGMGVPLPVITQFVLGAGRMLNHYGWLIILMIVGVVMFIRHQISTPAGHLAWDRRILRVPWLGPFVSNVEAARFTRTLGMLLEQGVPLVSGLRVVREVVDNRVIAGLLGEVEQSVKEGRGVAEPLIASGVFPLQAAHMIKVGEQTGELATMLSHVGAVCEKDTEVTITRVLALFEPVVIMVLGLIVAGIVFSLLAALLGINDLPK